MTRSRMLGARVLALVVALALVAAACGDDSGDDAAAPEDNAEADGNGDESEVGDEVSESEAEDAADGGLADRCPLGALDEADGPVEIVYWHSMPRENDVVLTQLADEFNASQDDVVVTLVNQTSYEDTLTKYRAGLASGDLPDVMQAEDKATQIMVDSQSTVPAQACIEAEGYDTSDHLQRALDYFTVDGVLWPMPFNVSNPVLYYNKAHFEAAGLDPEDPPTTLEGVREASDAIVAAGVARHGFAFIHYAWLIHTWMAMAGEPYVDNDNGRSDRATELLLDGETPLELFEWIDEMVDSGAAEDVGSPEGNNINHFLAVANGTSSMTIDTSAGIGTVLAVLGSGEFGDVEGGVGFLPGPHAPDGGTFVAGGSNFIVDGDDPARVEAAWRWVKFLNEPESQATWAQTGYIPIRESAAELPAVQNLWAETPLYKVAYDQLSSDVNNVATAGPLVGDFEGTDRAVEDAMERMLTEAQAPADALAQAKAEGEQILADYNSRVGG